MDPVDLAGSAPTGSGFAGSGPRSTFDLDPSSGQRPRDPTKTDPAGLIGSASGLHHDDELSKIKMEIEWLWSKRRPISHAVLPEAAKFRDTGLENAALLQVMFSKTVALGDTAWTPALGTMPPDPFRSRDLEEGSGDSGDDINVAAINLEPVILRFWPHFEGAIGAIDGTLIRAVIPKEDQISYIGRKPYPMQNIMAVCDFNMVFTFVVAGWPGATHDARIFTTTLNNYGHIFPHPPEGKYYLVDAGYPNIKGYLGPYTGGDPSLPAPATTPLRTPAPKLQCRSDLHGVGIGKNASSSKAAEEGRGRGREERGRAKEVPSSEMVEESWRGKTKRVAAGPQWGRR
uniref:DDE Tnp4 domain-containing protein n=1 Tax=Ananas comosus var. bracteatus TaxID=296719 RepID=A0A6V7Q5W8_ANACO|nr:unnamed protein product [Ananas comosus var. bracteatus]